MADRYTATICAYDELEEKLKHISALGLKWFIRSDYGGRREAYVYIFFDDDGMNKYLSREWGNKLDTVGEWVTSYKHNELDSIVLCERLVELFKDD